MDRGWRDDVGTGGTDLKFGCDLTRTDPRVFRPAVVVVVAVGRVRGPCDRHRQLVVSDPFDTGWSVNIDDGEPVRGAHEAGFDETAGRLAVGSGPVATPCSVKAAFLERQVSLTLAGSGGAAGGANCASRCTRRCCNGWTGLDHHHSEHVEAGVC